MLSPIAGKTGVFIIDAKNFYASAEEEWASGLDGKPIVVLSNNDGNIISRNDRARKLVPMGAPLFQYQSVLERHGTEFFSTNYVYYGDISRRFYEEVLEFSPDVERYSIDEVFMEVNEGKKKFDYLGRRIRDAVYKHVGIPTRVGIGVNKTLAKVAHYMARESTKADGVVDLYGSPYLDLALSKTPVEKIWNIGPRYAAELQRWKVTTALQFKYLPVRVVKKAFTIKGARTHQEINGLRAIPLELTPPAKKTIRCSRSFGESVSSYGEVYNAVSCFLMTALGKMREHRLAARGIEVFVSTSRFDEDNYDGNAYTYRSAYPSDNLFELQNWTEHCLRKIFKSGQDYKKAGVMLGGLIPACGVTKRLYPELQIDPKREKLGKAIEEINARHDKNTIRLAIANKGRWESKAAHLSPRRTTRLDELPRFY